MAAEARGAVRWVAERDPVDLATRLTLLLILFSDWVTGTDPVFQAPLKLVAIGALLLPPLHRSPWVWSPIAACMLAKSVAEFAVQDNHVFLVAYWTLGLGLCTWLREPGPALATTARWLVVLTFAFAMLWKAVLSPDFHDGTYFHFVFLADPRFFEFTTLFGGMDVAAVERNVQILTGLLDANREVLEVQLEDSPRIGLLAVLTTWWVVLVETAIAVLFLWPRARRPYRWRHAALIVFALTTYLAVPLDTFGWTLMILGLVGCEADMPRTRFAYVAACLVLKAYKLVPVLEVLG